MNHYFPKDTVLDERDRDVAAALGVILTPLKPEALRVVLMPEHAGVSTLKTSTLNERLDRVTCSRELLVSWGLSYAAFRYSFPRVAEVQPEPEEDEREERFSSMRDRLSSSAQQ